MPSRPVTLGFAAAAAAIAAVAALPAQPPGATSWSPAIVTIATPAGGASAQPQLSDSGRGVLLSWVEQAGERATLKFSERTPAGWSAARTVASGTDWFVNWADVPSVLRLTDGTLAAHWLQRSGSGTYAYDVRLSHSIDDGRTWSPPVRPHTDGTKTEHGFASLFEMPGAGLGLVWLDGRGTRPSDGRAGHGGGDAGAMSLRFAAFGRDWTPAAEAPVDARVCDCCPTAAALTADGPIVAFRNRTEEEVRDIYVSRYEHGGWTTPRAVAEDGWTIAACPVNGPMLAARGRDVAIAWFTGKDDEGRAQIAFSADAGRTFGRPIRLDDAGALGRVDVELMPDGSAMASWIEVADRRAHFRVRRVEPGGARSPAVTVSGVAGTRASGYPRMQRHGDELVFAWTQTVDGQSAVQTAAARVPSGAR